MSKPLDLTVYEIDRAEPSHVVVDGYWEYRPYDAAKRLTDAELAAEYHKQAHVFMLNGGANAPDALHQAQIWDNLHRFAALPHYDEVAA